MRIIDALGKDIDIIMKGMYTLGAAPKAHVDETVNRVRRLLNLIVKFKEEDTKKRNPDISALIVCQVVDQLVLFLWRSPLTRQVLQLQASGNSDVQTGNRILLVMERMFLLMKQKVFEELLSRVRPVCAGAMLIAHLRSSPLLRCARSSAF